MKNGTKSVLAVGVLVLVGAGPSGAAGKHATARSAVLTHATVKQATGKPAAGKPLDKAAYTAQVKAIGKPFIAAMDLVAGVKTPKTAEQGLTKLRTALRVAAERLDAITPPANVRRAHASLATAIREFAVEVGEMNAGLKTGKITTIITLPKLQGLKDIEAAATAIKNKGYAIDG